MFCQFLNVWLPRSVSTKLNGELWIVDESRNPVTAVRRMFKQPFGIPSVVLFVTSLPLAIGVIRINRVYGFAQRKTLGDDVTWLRVNRFAGIAIMIASVIYFTITFLNPYDGDFRIWLVHLAAFGIPLAAALTMSAAYAKRS